MNAALLRVVSMNFLYGIVHSVSKDFAPDVTEMANIHGLVIRVRHFRAMLMDLTTTDAPSLFLMMSMAVTVMNVPKKGG